MTKMLSIIEAVLIYFLGLLRRFWDAVRRRFRLKMGV